MKADTERILLVDDIVTSGESMKKCYGLLKEKYAEHTPAIIGPKIIELDVDECKYNHRLFDIPYYENKLRNLKEEKYIENKLDILSILPYNQKLYNQLDLLGTILENRKNVSIRQIPWDLF